MKISCVFVVQIVLAVTAALAEKPKEERNRITCECDVKYLENAVGYKETTLHTEYFQFNTNQKDPCNFDECASECKKIADEEYKNICDTVRPQDGLTKGGMEIFIGMTFLGSNALVCPKARLHLYKDICCKYCQCSLETTGMPLQANSQFIKLASFNNLVSGRREYSCYDYDAYADFESECEASCRKSIADYTSFKDIQTRPEKNYYVLTNDKAAADAACDNFFSSQYLQPPGNVILVQISGGENRALGWHKFIHLGKICCKVQCKCQVIKRTHKSGDFFAATDPDSKTIIKDLTGELPPENGASYLCESQAKQCLERCRIAASEYFKSDQLADLTKSVHELTIMKKFCVAKQACALLGSNVATNGVSFYLRYSTGDVRDFTYPEGDDIFLGHLCCSTYQGIPLFPFFECGSWPVSVSFSCP